MFAQRTDKICRKFFAFMEIAAYCTAPSCLSGRNSFLWFWLNRGLIVSIGCRRHVRKNLHVLCGGNEHSMASQVNRLLYHSADIAVCPCRNIVQAIGGTFAVCIAEKFIRVSAGLKAEMPECLKEGVLAQNGYVEYSFSLNSRKVLIYFLILMIN